MIFYQASNRATAKGTTISFSESSTFHPQEIILDGLLPNTKYNYTFLFTNNILTNDMIPSILYSLSLKEYSFLTFAIALTPFSYSFGTSACAATGSNSTVFDKIAAENLNFFFHLGDFFYGDIQENSTEKFYA